MEGKDGFTQRLVFLCVHSLRWFPAVAQFVLLSAVEVMKTSEAAAG